jgi:hypothetical protein
MHAHTLRHTSVNIVTIASFSDVNPRKSVPLEPSIHFEERGGGERGGGGAGIENVKLRASISFALTSSKNKKHRGSVLFALTVLSVDPTHKSSARSKNKSGKISKVQNLVLQTTETRSRERARARERE